MQFNISSEVPERHSPPTHHAEMAAAFTPTDRQRPNAAREPIVLEWCQACDYGLLKPRPSGAEIAAHYELGEYYTHHAPLTGAV